MENFNENIVENDIINEEFEETEKETEFNTEDEGEGSSAAAIVKGIALVAGLGIIVYKGGKFLYKKVKDKTKAKLIEELKAEGWVNPNETQIEDAEEADNNEEE